MLRFFYSLHFKNCTWLQIKEWTRNSAIILNQDLISFNFSHNSSYGKLTLGKQMCMCFWNGRHEAYQTRQREPFIYQRSVFWSLITLLIREAKTEAMVKLSHWVSFQVHHLLAQVTFKKFTLLALLFSSSFPHFSFWKLAIKEARHLKWTANMRKIKDKASKRPKRASN